MRLAFRKSLTRIACITLAVLTVVAAQDLSAQTQTQTQTQLKFEGQPFVFNEFGAIIAEQEGALKIQMMVMEPEQREPAYRKVDLKAGDQIVMVNGKRAKSTADLEAAYKALKAGEEITLAIKRDQARMMVNFPKGDPEKQGARIMVRTMPEGGEDNAVPILGLGLLVSETDGKVEVVDKLPVPPGFPENLDFKQGDIIAKLQNEPVVSVTDLETRYGAIATGDKVTVEVLRGGDVEVFGFAKPEAPQGRIMMKKQ